MKNDQRCAAVLSLLALGYPILVYFGLKRYPPKLIALAVGGALLGRLFCGRNQKGRWRLSLLFVPPLGLCAVSAALNNQEFILYLPALASLALLFSFAFTLFRPPSAVESFARVSVPNLTVDEVAHCRRTTEAWVVFFLVNGLIAFWTARWSSLKTWALYNGLLTYIAMGALFSAEFIYRHWRFRRYVGLPTDVLFRRLFPPKV